MPKQQKNKGQQQPAPAKEVEEEACDMADPFEMMGGMGEEQVYQVTCVQEAPAEGAAAAKGGDASKELEAARKEIAELKKELAQATPRGAQPPMAKIIAAQEEVTKQRARAEQAEGRIQTLMRDLEAVTAREQKAKAEATQTAELLSNERAMVAKLMAELEKNKGITMQLIEAIQAEEAEAEAAAAAEAAAEAGEEAAEEAEAPAAEEPVEEAPAPAAASPAAEKKGPNKRERKQLKKQQEQEASPAAAAPAPAPAAKPMARLTADLQSAQDRLAKRVAALEEQRAQERALAEQRRKEEEEERREEEEAEKLRQQLKAEEEAREEQKRQAKAEEAAKAAEKLRRKEERKRQAAENERRLAEEKKVFSKEDFEALQLLREDVESMQPDAEVSPDELDEDEILELEMKRAQKEAEAMKSTQNQPPTNFLAMMMKAEGIPMMSPEVMAQAKKSQQNTQRNALKQKLQAKREMDKILDRQGVPKARR